MQNQSELQLRSIPVDELPFDADFTILASNLDLNSFGEILDIEPAGLLKIPGFTYHHLQQLGQFLEEKNMGHLLKQKLPAS